VATKVLGAIVGSCLIASIPLAAQSPAPPGASAQTAQGDAQGKEQRYQIGVLERVFEGAVEHGLTTVRDRMQAVVKAPTDLLLSDNAHARGFVLEGYGVFFDVSVPSFETTSWWTLRTLDQNDLGLDSAMKELQTLVKNSGNVSAEQALKRVELQVTPVTLAPRPPDPAVVTRESQRTGSTASVADPTNGPKNPTADPILQDPSEAYRAEVIDALKDAMLDHSSSLGIGANEWLTIAARGNSDRPRLSPADSDSRTRVIRLRGADLAAYLARQITKDEARERIEVRVF